VSLTIEKDVQNLLRRMLQQSIGSDGLWVISFNDFWNEFKKMIQENGKKLVQLKQ
jgi:hypothetical protein